MRSSAAATGARGGSTGGERPRRAAAVVEGRSLARVLAGLHRDRWPTRFVGEAARPGPLDAVLAFAGTLCWTYVTSGLAARRGHELTARVARAQSDHGPPAWPATLLHRVAHALERAQRRVRPGEILPAGRRISPHLPADRTAVLVVDDPELAPVDTVDGTVRFLAAIALTTRESEAAARGAAAWTIALRLAHEPLGLLT